MAENEFNSYLLDDAVPFRNGVFFGGGSGFAGPSVVGGDNYNFSGVAVPYPTDTVITSPKGESTNLGYLPITEQSGTATSDIFYRFRVSSNIEGASIFFNKENTFQTTTYTFSKKISEILVKPIEVTLEKLGYTSKEKFVITVVENPNFNLNLNINPFDSLFGYANRGIIDISNSNIAYSNAPLWTVKILYYSDENTIEEYPYNIDSLLKILEFTKVTKEIPKDTPPIDTPPVDNFVNVKINLKGIDGSAEIAPSGISIRRTPLNLSVGTNELSLDTNTTYILKATNRTYRISSLQYISTINNFNEDKTALPTESLSLTYSPAAGDIINLVVEEVPVVQLDDFAKLQFINSETSREYNINSNSDIPIGLRKLTTVSNLKVYINEKEIEFNVPQTNEFIISIPSNNFTRLGAYKVLLLPSNTRGDGEFLELTINVVDEFYVGVPDIRNITYPSELFGPDYVGTNVDFSISYDSVNTDYVRIYKVGTDKFIKAAPSGKIDLNFEQLLLLDGSSNFDDVDKISVVLKLVPYNEEGNEVVTGKEEIITIKFDKGDLTIPRDLAINRIIEGFINQFNDSVFNIDTSKYLTHLLHLGGGDNKVITTWTGHKGSLILKLYEPLPTSVQPNQQVWISKLQANPIVETITISGVDTSYCPPLKGPNFSLEADNGIGFKVFDELIASGSNTSAELINKFAEQNTIDTEKLNIQYVSGSDYVWDNYVHFGSAEERVNNFFYKLKVLENLTTKYKELYAETFTPPYESLQAALLTEDGGGAGTPEIDGNEEIQTEDALYSLNWEVYVQQGLSQTEELESLANKINNLIKSFDGFEKWLYKTEHNLAFPKENYIAPNGVVFRVVKPWQSLQSQGWLDFASNSGAIYDVDNPHSMKNNMPEHIIEDYQNAEFLLFLDMVGQHFDILWCYINALKANKNLEHKQDVGISNAMVYQMLDSLGWKGKRAFDSQFLWEYVLGTSKEGGYKYGRSLEDANNEVWRRILNNLPYLLKHKGTARAMKAVMACYGVPQSMLTIMEFGGPQDPTKGASSQFTFDDRTAAIYLKDDANVKIPWKTITGFGDYPNAVEFRIKPTYTPNPIYTLISGSEWSLDLVKTTGSFAKLELNFGGNKSTSTYFDEPFVSGSPSVSTVYIEYINDEPYAYGPDFKTGSLHFPVSTEYYSNVLINRHNSPDSSSWFEVLYATTNGTRITTFVSMSLQTDDTEWETGSFLQIGGNNYEGNVDEFRLWKTPLLRSKFENHTLFPDAINGNSYTASTADLVFRLDFEYPKDRTSDIGIKNVSINTSYDVKFASASMMYSASTYPYQYTPYDRTVTATVPSLGFTYSNKIRFESASLVTDLSYKTRATKKSFDQAPIDSSRLGLFFSPIKELNMDILKAFGDFNIDNYIGDPSDDYRDRYKTLDDLRSYYFERLENRDIYEYIRLIKYIDKSLFEVLADLAPARAKISKGLLIEPHYLERSKTKWSKPESLRNDYETKINTADDNQIELEYSVKNAFINNEEVTSFLVDLPNYDTSVDANDIVILESTNPTYDSKINYSFDNLIETAYPTYPNTGSINITFPLGETLLGSVDVFTSTQIGMERDSLANAGFGLYAKSGSGIVRNWEGVFGNCQLTGSRKSIFLVKEQYTEFVNEQISGYPVSGYQPGDQVKYKKQPVTKYKYRVSTLPFSGSVQIGNDVVEVQPVNGYLPSHYKFKNNLAEGMIRSFWKGSQQTAATTPDGLSPVETFTTNPNILRVAKTGRGSGEPILEVD
jgi:hypothetical protein